MQDGSFIPSGIFFVHMIYDSRGTKLCEHNSLHTAAFPMLLCWQCPTRQKNSFRIHTKNTTLTSRKISLLLPWSYLKETIHWNSFRFLLVFIGRQLLHFKIVYKQLWKVEVVQVISYCCFNKDFYQRTIGYPPDFMTMIFVGVLSV